MGPAEAFVTSPFPPTPSSCPTPFGCLGWGSCIASHQVSLFPSEGDVSRPQYPTGKSSIYCLLRGLEFLPIQTSAGHTGAASGKRVGACKHRAMPRSGRRVASSDLASHTHLKTARKSDGAGPHRRCFLSAACDDLAEHLTREQAQLPAGPWVSRTNLPRLVRSSRSHTWPVPRQPRCKNRTICCWGGQVGSVFRLIH